MNASSANRIVTVPGNMGRMLYIRVLPWSDLITSLYQGCRDHGIRTATVLCAAGSFKHAVVSWAEPTMETRRGSRRTEPIKLNGPLEIVSFMGVMSACDTDEPVGHFHASLCDPSGRVWGAHLFSGQNMTHSTVDVVLAETLNVSLAKLYDEEIDVEILQPET